MNVTLLKRYSYGLILSILTIIVNIELIQKSIDNLSNNYLINISALTMYFFNPLLSLINLIAIVLTYYFIIKIYIIIFQKEKK